jgi:hypothetical protein
VLVHREIDTERAAQKRDWLEKGINYLSIPKAAADSLVNAGRLGGKNLCNAGLAVSAQATLRQGESADLTRFSRPILLILSKSSSMTQRALKGPKACLGQSRTSCPMATQQFSVKR